MYDGINADAEIIHQNFPHSPVATYINGGYAWSPAQEHMFGRKIRISVEAGQPEAARYARCIDVERGAATAADVKPFLEVRAKYDKVNGTVYCDLSNVKPVLAACPDQDIPRFWLAYYWQRPGSPSREYVLSVLARDYGVDLPPEKAWACQYASYPQWDVSVVYGRQDFSR
jgi:hypothetical protein